MAWLRAICPQVGYRDGNRAVEFATKACELTAWKVSEYIDTLAAAFAELGKFSDAVQHESKAIELAADEKQKKPMRERLALYESNQPYHETAK
jgi:hypothetical protein